MFEIIRSGGWMMIPLILCSIAALAIIGERLWTLRRHQVIPPRLIEQVRKWLAAGQVDDTRLRLLRDSSPMGRVLAAGLANRHHPRDILREAVEDSGRHVAPELERYLSSLGTIAAISPFLGLLGTVLGMIDMFAGIGQQGLGDPSVVASGISQALIATASGLAVAIPSLMFYRYLRTRVDRLLLDMEQEAIGLIEIIQGVRARDVAGDSGDSA